MQQNIKLDSDKALTALFVLYVHNVETFYLPQFEPFVHAAYWLEIAEQEDYIPYDFAVDICAGCLSVWNTTIHGGHVRTRCWNCIKIGWKDRFFTDPWPNRISQLIGLSPEIVEFYTAKALHIHKQAREQRTQDERPIQPDIQADRRTDTERTRRFNIGPSKQT